MLGKERLRDRIAFSIVNNFGATFKARLMDKLPLYREAFFCSGVYCYISSMMELSRSERLYLPEVRNWLESFSQNDIFYDIGANIGMFSLTVAKIYGGQVKTYAFEPSFSTFGSLVHNVIGNGFGNVIIPFSIALSNGLGMRSFNYTDLTTGASVHTLDTLVNQTGKEFNPVFKQQVISYSLDNLIEDFAFPVPTHIKIDVDGGELEIVEGMQKTLRKPEIKSILIEITETQKDDVQVQSLMAMFKDAGFKRTQDIPHSRHKSYPFVSDILFTKDWTLSYGKNTAN